LVDLGSRRFFFFWIEIWPHEFYFVAGLLIMAGLGLFLVTSALGRAWGGYACPQTVWTDLFILVERWIEGDRNARVKLHHAPFSLRKLRLRLVKWVTWLLIGLATGGAWVFYFTDAPQLLNDLFTLNAHPIAYTTIAILTATTFFFGGFAREQICIYACPWPRIQAAMMDPDTLTVGYRDWRGEPRGKKRDAGAGDCVDCMACVNVCPMGIDIRDGQQMECITCALCIDACDDVMDKLGRERGLIDYLSLADEPAERAGAKPKAIWQHILRPRTILYTALWSLMGVALIYGLFIRSDLEITASPVRNPVYVQLSNGDIRNIYDLRIRNKSGEARVFELSVTSDERLNLSIEGVENSQQITVAADSMRVQRVYVTAGREDTAANAARTELRFWVEDPKTESRVSSRMTTFHGRDK
jgi:cytochrome c oxidase accessory protein FixG